MTLGQKIIELRKKKGLTQEYLAEKLKISRQTLSNWENNITSPDIVQAKNIASFFEISLDDLTDNYIELKCKDQSNHLLNHLVGKECFISFDDEFIDATMNYNTQFKIIEIGSRFVKVQYQLKKETMIKLIDIDMILGFKVVLKENK
jgi:Predicted transcriptional regulators